MIQSNADSVDVLLAGSVQDAEDWFFGFPVMQGNVCVVTPVGGESALQGRIVRNVYATDQFAACSGASDLSTLVARQVRLTSRSRFPSPVRI